MMNEKKIEYLKNQIGFHMEDLTPRRRAELQAFTNLSPEWKYAALSKKSVDNWNALGFGLFRNFDFVKEINVYLDAIEAMEEEAFEVKRSELSESGKVINMYYKPRQPRNNRPLTTKERVSAQIDNFFLLLEGGGDEL